MTKSNIRRGSEPPQPKIYGKMPPQAAELEAAVLGAMMLEKEKQREVLAIIKSRDVFYSEPHALIYEAIQAMYARGQIIDLLTVTNELRKRETLEVVGGAYYVSQLTMAVISSAHVEAHCRVILEKWIGREIIRIGLAAVSDAYDDAEDIFEQLERLEIQLAGITDRIRTGSIKRLGEALPEVVEDMRAARNRETGMVGISTGLRWEPHGDRFRHRGGENNAGSIYCNEHRAVRRVSWIFLAGNARPRADLEGHFIGIERGCEQCDVRQLLLGKVATLRARYHGEAL
jgi:hypothetical protein